MHDLWSKSLILARKEHIRERVGLFKYVTGTKKTVVNTFVTTYGVANGKYSSIVHSNVVLDDLFKA